MIIILNKINSKGMASLPTVIALSMLIMIVGILITSVSVAENISTAGSMNSDKALAYAEAGANDALERLVRNKNYVGAYSLDMIANGCDTQFTGCSAVEVGAGNNPKVITSLGRVGATYRKIQVEVNLDSNGLITNYSWQSL